MFDLITVIFFFRTKYMVGPSIVISSRGTPLGTAYGGRTARNTPGCPQWAPYGCFACGHGGLIAELYKGAAARQKDPPCHFIRVPVLVQTQRIHLKKEK
jgi:hypothetical protein